MGADSGISKCVSAACSCLGPRNAGVVGDHLDTDESNPESIRQGHSSHRFGSDQKGCVACSDATSLKTFSSMGK